MYSSFYDLGIPVLFTSLVNAELIKYASNAFLATKISFINEMANYCDTVGGNIKDVATGVGLDSRIGSDFLNAGIGFGGSCLPKDLKAIVELGKKAGFDFNLLRAVLKVNESQVAKIFNTLSQEFGNLSNINVAIWGMAFKPETDDLRDAPSLKVVEKLISSGAKVSVYDPVAHANFKSVFGDSVVYSANSCDATADADALLVLTEWREFETPDFDKLKKLMRGNVLIDGRNIYSPSDVNGFGFKYYGFGQQL